MNTRVSGGPGPVDHAGRPEQPGEPGLPKSPPSEEDQGRMRQALGGPQDSGRNSVREGNGQLAPDGSSGETELGELFTRSSQTPSSPEGQERMRRAPGPQDRSRDSGQEKEPAQGVLSGDAVLQGLFARASQSDAGTTLVAGSPNAAERAEALAGVAERVLVSAPSQAEGEVRIQLKESVLPGVEIRLTRQDGLLAVHVVASEPSSANFFAMHREGLQQHLENRLGENVRVEVRQETSGSGGDGRSRQRRDLYAELRERDE